MNFNTNCFQACLHKLKWKKENNEFHYFQSLANKHIFSYEAVNEIIKRITQDDNFLMQAKKNFNSK